MNSIVNLDNAIKKARKAGKDKYLKSKGRKAYKEIDKVFMEEYSKDDTLERLFSVFVYSSYLMCADKVLGTSEPEPEMGYVIRTLTDMLKGRCDDAEDYKTFKSILRTMGYA